MGNDNIPIKHHYIPRFYLANFSEDGSSDSKIWVTDQKQCKQWRASISAIAYQNKLYSLEDNTDQMIQTEAIEKAFSQVEGMTASVIKEIYNRDLMSNHYDYDTI